MELDEFEAGDTTPEVPPRVFDLALLALVVALVTASYAMGHCVDPVGVDAAITEGAGQGRERWSTKPGSNGSNGPMVSAARSVSSRPSSPVGQE